MHARVSGSVIGGGTILGLGIGLLLDHPGAGVLIGLGAGIIVGEVLSLPIRIMEREERAARRGD